MKHTSCTRESSFHSPMDFSRILNSSAQLPHPYSHPRATTNPRTSTSPSPPHSNPAPSTSSTCTNYGSSSPFRDLEIPDPPRTPPAPFYLWPDSRPETRLSPEANPDSPQNFDSTEYDHLFDETNNYLSDPSNATWRQPTPQYSPRPPRSEATTPRPRIDLTSSSPYELPATMPDHARKRKRADPHDISRPWPTSAQRRPRSGNVRQAGGISTPPQNPSVNQISLVDDDDNTPHSLAATLRKQRADQIASQSAASPANRQEDGAGAPKKGVTKLTTMTCTVCLDSVTDLTATTCGHAFCRACLMNWVGTKAAPPQQRRPNCPACRTPLRMGGRSQPVLTLEFMMRPKGGAGGVRKTSDWAAV